MDRSNWKLILPSAAAGGFVLVGFWGLLAGPLAASAFFLQRERADDAEAGEGDEGRRLAAFMAEHAQAELAKAARADPPAARPAVAPARKANLAEMKARAQQLDAGAVFDALARARLAQLEAPGDAHAAAEVALLARRLAADDRQAAWRLRSARRAIVAALNSAQPALATGVFTEYLAERSELALEPTHWEALGNALLAQGAFMEAAWALHAAALLAGDELAAQKRLVETAAKAAAAGQPRAALRLYRTLLEKYPATQYAQFVRASMREQEGRVTKP